MGIEATQFVTSSGRQVLTNDGQQGMGGNRVWDRQLKRCRAG